MSMLFGEYPAVFFKTTGFKATRSQLVAIKPLHPKKLRADSILALYIFFPFWIEIEFWTLSWHFDNVVQSWCLSRTLDPRHGFIRIALLHIQQALFWTCSDVTITIVSSSKASRIALVIDCFGPLTVLAYET